MNDEIFTEITEEAAAYKPFKLKTYLLYGVPVVFTTIGISLVLLLQYLETPPQNFPLNQDIVIQPGTSLREAISIAKENNLVRSELALYLNFVTKNKNKTIKAGKYNFAEPLNLNSVAEELIRGNPEAELIKFTHIEGESVRSLVKRADEVLTDFDKDLFLRLAENKEGMLFPETYLIPENYTTDELFTLLHDTFTEKTTPLQERVNNHFLSFNEILTLASIIEREANTKETKEMVSGILQNRLKINMPLQADASIEYVLNKPLSELTPEDLKIDSPFNTYLNTGLPPHPIGNPGLEAILAVLEPQSSNYLFYITGNDGNFYYAENFDQHRLNIAKYLR